MSIVVRDAGGLGDVARIFPILDALAERGAVWFYTDPCYAGLCSMCPSVAAGRCTVRPWHGHRHPLGAGPACWGSIAPGHAVVADHPGDAPVIDLFCPALMHEVQTGGRPSMDRVECWARAAGVWPVPAGSVRLQLDESVQREAAHWALGVGRPAVAVSPSSNAGIRTWRNGAAPAGRQGLVGDALLRLKAAGYNPVVFSTAPLGLPGSQSVEHDVRVQTARLAMCDAFVGPDSGFLHLACALGLPAVAIFGPTHPHLVLRPYTNPVIVLRGRWGPAEIKRIGCSGPCYGLLAAGYNRRICAGRCEVMEQVPEAEIVRAVQKLVRRPRSLLLGPAS